MISKPAELAEAELVLGLAERFSCPPHEVYGWPASTLRLLRIEALGRPPEKKRKGGDFGEWQI